MPKFDVQIVTDADPSLGEGLFLKPGGNLVTGATAFRSHFGAPTSLEEDLLTLAAAVYASDVGIIRGERETYSRQLRVKIPVVNFHAFNSVRKQIEYCLAVLSTDVWELDFVRSSGSQEEKSVWPTQDGEVLLFSGGLDSLGQAVRLADRGGDFALVSHDSGNLETHAAQATLVSHLRATSTTDPPHYAFRVRGQNRSSWKYPTTHESSQRTRSFLFLTLGALVARRRGAQRLLLMAENGQMAIHVPLTAARIGAFSTRTAHPEVINVAQNLFSELLDFKLTIENPFLYSTKAEVVEPLCSTVHISALRHSISCWMASRVKGDASHCGFCIPCLIRRIALEFWNKPETTVWDRNLLAENVKSLPASDDGKRNLIDLLEFVRVISSDLTMTELVLEFPELINSNFDVDRAIAMYRRFGTEATHVLSRYPQVSGLM